MCINVLGGTFRSVSRFNANCIAYCGLWSKKMEKMEKHHRGVPLADTGSYWIDTFKNTHLKNTSFYDCYH